MSSVKTENSNLLQLPPLTPQKKQSREHTRVEKTSTPIKYAEAARESISGQLKHWKKSKQKEARLRRQLLLADELQRLLAESGEEEVEFFKTKTFADREELGISRENVKVKSSSELFSDSGSDDESSFGRRSKKLKETYSGKMKRTSPPEYQRPDEQITIQHMIELMKVFHKADEEGNEGLNENEFRAAFSQILGRKLNYKFLATLFYKIDTQCYGTINWNDFCSYLLSEYQERDNMVGKETPYPHPFKKMLSYAHDVTCIAFLPDGKHRTYSRKYQTNAKDVEGVYVTICTDGTLSYWNSDLTLQKVVTIDVGKLPWITDMVVLPNANKMIISLTDSKLSIYDCNTNEHVFSIIKLPFCVLTMTYWINPIDPNRALLIMGDTEGGIFIMEFNKAMTYLFIPNMGSNLVSFFELMNQKYDGVRTSYFPKVHNDWVLKVKYWHSMGYIISCSNDENNSLNLFDINGGNRGASLKVRKGVFSFDFCKEWNFIATGGMDRILRFWNPYLTGHPITVLRGHVSAIMHVVISNHKHVYSLSKDMEIRVWNISDQTCLQIINRCHPLLPHPPTAFFVHPFTELIMIANSRLGALVPTTKEDDYQKSIGEKTHDRPLCAALYNENFGQVVSGCHGSVVSVWDVDTGEKIIHFSKCHGEHEITAMIFDKAGRKLLTGGKDGSIKVWNFNNGACLCVLRNNYHSEVTGICFTSSNIIIGGWFRAFATYNNSWRDPNGEIEDFTYPKYFGHGIHKEDVLCMAHQEPYMLASASYDGSIHLWHIDADHSKYMIRRLHGWDNSGRLPSPRFRRNSYVYRKSGALKWEYDKNEKFMSRLPPEEDTLTCELNTFPSFEIMTIPIQIYNTHAESDELEPQRLASFNTEDCRNTAISSRRTQKRFTTWPFSRNFHPPPITAKDKCAIEMIAFIPKRETDINSATLVAVGTGGWVYMWNIHGGGLIGRFNIWSCNRHLLPESKWSSQSVTSLKIDSKGAMLVTGNSLGYIQVWRITNYCLKVPDDVLKPIQQPPRYGIAWRAHLSSVVSIDLAEAKSLIITASTDCSVRLWTKDARYIGTFGEKVNWKLTYPLDVASLPHKIPRSLKACSSAVTMDITSGAATSKWTVARKIFRVLREAKKELLAMESYYRKCIDRDPDYYAPKKWILGKHFERKTRFRKPMAKIKLTRDSNVFSIYRKLDCMDMKEPGEISLPESQVLLPTPPPSVISKAVTHVSKAAPCCADHNQMEVLFPPKFPLTEASLNLPPLTDHLKKKKLAVQQKSRVVFALNVMQNYEERIKSGDSNDFRLPSTGLDDTLFHNKKGITHESSTGSNKRWAVFNVLSRSMESENESNHRGSLFGTQEGSTEDEYECNTSVASSIRRHTVG